MEWLVGEAAGVQRRQIGAGSQAEANRDGQWRRRLEQFWSGGRRKIQAGQARSKNERLDEMVSQVGISNVRSGGDGKARSWRRMS